MQADISVAETMLELERAAQVRRCYLDNGLGEATIQKCYSIVN